MEFKAKEIFVAIRSNGQWRFRYFGEPNDDGSCANENESQVQSVGRPAILDRAKTLTKPSKTTEYRAPRQSWTDCKKFSGKKEDHA